MDTSPSRGVAAPRRLRAAKLEELVALDPEELSGGLDVPDLGGAVLLHFFDGFIDAGSGGQARRRASAEHLRHRVIAPGSTSDRLIDYHSRRPTMTYAIDHSESYDAPELMSSTLLHDADGVPLLLLTGPERMRAWEQLLRGLRDWRRVGTYG